MNIHALKVSAGNKGAIVIALRGHWILEWGFIPGALVQVIIEQGCVSFTLCGNSVTRKHGSNIITALVCHKSPMLIASGKYIRNSGLVVGDNLIACCAPGFIRVKKLPVGVRIINMTDDKIWLSGYWLANIGFTPGIVALIRSEPGKIIIEQYREAAKSPTSVACPPEGFADHDHYANLTRFARKHKMKLLQFEQRCSKKPYACVHIDGFVVKKSGFSSGDTLMATCEYGSITLQKLDLNMVGF